jgi:hypothetical protein
MSKEYMLPSKTDERPTDITLYGSNDFSTDGQIHNKTTKPKLANIVELSSQQDSIFNDGKISYTTRYIQRSYGSFRQATMVDNDKTWVYQPALLWEVAGEQTNKSVNDVVSDQSKFTLAAIPLESDLSDAVPFVENGVIKNNVFNFGEAVYWLTRYNGYLYANGEIIKFDAVEYEIPGVDKSVFQRTNNGSVSVSTTNTGAIGRVWITSVRDYQKYFAKLPFNGKMYPTGRVRIYSEPNYVTVNGVEKLADGPVAKHGRCQFGTGRISEDGLVVPVYHSAGLSSYWTSASSVRGCSMKSSQLFGSPTETQVQVGQAGQSNSTATNATRTGVIKNILAYTPSSETITQNRIAPGTVQSSALVFTGPSFTTTQTPIDFISYVYKPLDNKYKHFGTRARIIGKIENNENSGQTPTGASQYYVGNPNSPTQPVTINGASGGLAVMINPETNNGYYFEIAALTENNIKSYDNADNIHNILFYKVGKSLDNSATQAVPIKLWGDLADITVDSGDFTGQFRMANEKKPTVYDLAVEYQDVGSSRRFFLYVNNKLVATVLDDSPLPIYNNMALFVRGSSRVMFENIYAITNNYSQNTVYALDTPVNAAFSDDEIDMNESLRRYAMSGVIQSSYLSGISPAESPKYSMYFEEFGTIMREAVYFNVKYDKAFPALYAKLAPTFNKIKGYTTSGFIASAYSAEFMVFNATDTLLSLDEASGNYLRIQGVTFTQQSTHEYTVDEYFDKNSDYSNPQFSAGQLVSYPNKAKKDYQDIKVSRLTHGSKEFTLDAPYIQSHDEAENLLGWMISKIMKPRKSVGLQVFGIPTLQLGDIVEIDYKDDEGINQASLDGARFVVYQIEYAKTSEGPEMTVFLSEVA